MAIFTGDSRDNSIRGTDTADSINGRGGDDRLLGRDGDDSLTGGFGADTLFGQRGADTLVGGIGNDVLFGGTGADSASLDVSRDGADSMDLGSGLDIVNVSASSASQVRLTFTSSEVGNGSSTDSGGLANQDGDLAVRMQAERDSGGLNGDVTRADDEGVNFVAGNGVTFDVRDLVSGAQRGDQFAVVQLGTSHNEAITALQVASETYINAGAGNDSVTAGFADSFLVGGSGNDTLVGSLGADSLLGGSGSDQLTGGAGADRFIFTVASNGQTTVVTDLSNADTIDLSPIDADTGREGDQAFDFVDHFSGKAGEAVLQYNTDQNATRLFLDVDGDGQADAKIRLDGGDFTDFSNFVA